MSTGTTSAPPFFKLRTTTETNFIISFILHLRPNSSYATASGLPALISANAYCISLNNGEAFFVSVAIFSQAFEIVIPAFTRIVILFTNSGNSILIDNLLFSIFSFKLLSTTNGIPKKAIYAATANIKPVLESPVVAIIKLNNAMAAATVIPIAVLFAL